MLPRRARTSFRALALIAILTIVLGGCAPEAKPAATPAKPPAPAISPPVAAPATTPAPAAAKRGGILRLYWTTDASTLDPHVNGSRNYEALVPHSPPLRTTPDLKIVPNVAESWEVSPDGLVWTLKIRKGVNFHNKPPTNGREATADDVAYSIQRVGTKGAPFTRQYMVEPIVKYETPDKYTVKLTTSFPFASLLRYLANETLAIIPKEFVEANKGDLRLASLGVGPFYLESFDPKVIWRMRRHPGYFRPGLPHLDGVDQVIIPDKATQIAAFRAGKLDVLRSDFSRLDVEVVKRTEPNVQVYKLWMGMAIIYLGNDRPPFKDLRLRRAVSMGIDRQELNKIVNQGDGELGVFLAPYVKEYALAKKEWENLPGYRAPTAQDIAEAKRLVAEAGYPNGLTVESTAFWAVWNHNTALREQLARIGIRVTIANDDIAEWRRKIQNKLYQMAVRLERIEVEPEMWISENYVAPNTHGYDNPKVADLFQKQRRELDERKRIDMFQEIQRILAQEWPTVPLYNVPQMIMAKPHVRNYELMLSIPFYRSYQYIDELWLDN